MSKWYKTSEKLPDDRTLVAIWYGTIRPQPVDHRYDVTVYNLYRMAYYEGGKWLDCEDIDINLSDKYRIDSWCEIPFQNGKSLKSELVEVEPIGNRFDILDL